MPNDPNPNFLRTSNTRLTFSFGGIYPEIDISCESRIAVKYDSISPNHQILSLLFVEQFYKFFEIAVECHR